MSKKVRCIIVDDEPVARDIIRSFVEKVPNLELARICKSASEAFSILNEEHIDLVFLDINMPEITGLTLAKSLRNHTKVIFTTAYREYAIEGFDLQAVDYLLKPISFDRFLKSVQKYFDLHHPKSPTSEKDSQEKKATHFFVRSERKMVKINFEDIIYIESLSDYIKIHTTENIVVTRETISNVESKLPRHSFLRTHRSYIVSIGKVDSYTNEFVELNKKAIPISRSYKDYVLKKLTGES